MKKILYLANLRLPTEKAYGIQISKMCEAFADQGADLTLVYPYRKNKIKDDFFNYYFIKNNFKLKKIWSPDFYLSGNLDRISFYIKNFISAVLLSIYSLFKKADIIYSRDELIIFTLSFFRKSSSLALEVHRIGKSKMLFYKRFKKINLKIIAITQAIKNELLNSGFKGANLFVAPDAVHFEQFDIDLSKEDARRKLNLPIDKTMVIYTGHLFEWKGVYTLLEAAKELKGLLFVFVGGMPVDINNFKKNANKLNNVLILGQRPHKEIPLFLKAADVLILPNSGKTNISRTYTSPIKLFEYMVSKRPIVASSLPSIREILDDQNSILVKPDNAESLARGIEKAIEGGEFINNILNNAFKAGHEHTWEKRTWEILKFINHKPT